MHSVVQIHTRQHKNH